ncbi:DUF5686 and carboxypeptidase-like regulatory domain-containing protein [Aquimarina mytili]|uniref:Carboxypeptidase-like regulatory domain-containing protein n=1 Tax=Aquimarina mytili TaxID=874423 RepID=A0A936ZS67_9FLAO|nr:DUF5686 and carboxypeptidase-like regulatory domain-containing protein [Aquimarina mytili]MBL0683718.1 carboxypeptidase-like regulatory domain-containing protein [Aquimarina mytili]
MRNKLFCLLFFTHFILIAQVSIKGTVTDASSSQPLPFATVKTGTESYAMTSVNGEFVIRCKNYPVNLTVSFLGYQTKNIQIPSKSTGKIEIKLLPKEESLSAVNLDITENVASKIIKEAIRRKRQNNPKKALNSYSYKSYNKLKITKDNQAKLDTRDTTKIDMQRLFNEAHSFLSEKISLHQFRKGIDEKETVLATRMTGFKEPIYNILGIKIQSNSLYEDDYTIFNNKYIGPLSNRALRNYYYKILGTTRAKKPAFIILFQPRKSKKFASLEGILYLDIKTLQIQNAIIELRGELNVMATHNFEYFSEQENWFPISQEITIRPGDGRQKVSLFGGQISIGRVGNSKKDTINNDFLVSKTDLFDIKLNTPQDIKQGDASIKIAPEANDRSEVYWNQYRTSTITEKDSNSFPVVDSIVKAQNIERKIDVIQSFNIGYYPVGFFNFDLTYPIKYNNFEGLRLGLGGLTNAKFSKRFRLEGYLVYGFRDSKSKFGIGGGMLINKNSGSWLNVNYTDDIREVGSFLYLTDRRVYSLFEPRLVNIDFYYKHRTWSSSIQHQISPKFLSEAQFSVSNINQTKGYQYLNDGALFSAYKTVESTIALRWSPFSKFLQTPKGMKEIHEGYPKISAQYTQGFKGVFDGSFDYSKIGIKAEYVINRINQSRTSFLLEANVATGDVPLTHLYHAYPNAPTKETVLQRFSVAGRRTFETMFFGEFFSDRLATLQLKHSIKPFRVVNWLNPELVFITRYAIGDVDNIQNHQGVDFGSLQQLYQESGFEINKLFAGFGLSFAYRYGAYHLPRFEDNISFKFTFYLKL